MKLKKRMVWENFGNKEFRKLDDKYGKYICDYEFKTGSEKLFEFKEWCENFTLVNQKRRIK